ncbi:hypothetical protein PGB90_008001 [Kerria lacca]
MFSPHSKSNLGFLYIRNSNVNIDELNEVITHSPTLNGIYTLLARVHLTETVTSQSNYFIQHLR